MAEIKESYLFELLGRLFAEVQATTRENERLHALTAQLQAEAKKEPEEELNG